MQVRRLMATSIYFITNKGFCICVVIHDILKMFPESPYFWEIPDITII